MSLSFRILILDWDVHHGQGIQYFFYNDPRYVPLSICSILTCGVFLCSAFSLSSGTNIKLKKKNFGERNTNFNYFKLFISFINHDFEKGEKVYLLVLFIEVTEFLLVKLLVMRYDCQD